MRVCFKGDGVMNTAQAGSFGPKRMLQLLLLDRSVFDRRRLQRSLAQAKIPCAIAEAGTFATFLDLLQARAYDIIVLDYAIADETALQALARCKVSRMNAQAFCVMMTRHDADPVAPGVLRAGFDAVLTKDRLDAAGMAGLARAAAERQRARSGDGGSASGQAVLPVRSNARRTAPSVERLRSHPSLEELPEPSLSLLTWPAGPSIGAAASALLIQAEQKRILVDYGGAWRAHSGLPFPGPHADGLVDPNPRAVTLQTVPITLAIATAALRQARQHCGVPRPFATRAICQSLGCVPGFEDLPKTFCARKLSQDFADFLGARPIRLLPSTATRSLEPNGPGAQPCAPVRWVRHKT